jgi:hypothetical protein
MHRRLDAVPSELLGDNFAFKIVVFAYKYTSIALVATDYTSALQQ